MKPFKNALAWLKTAAKKAVARLDKIAKDKYQHFAVGFVLAAGAMLLSLWVGVPFLFALLISAVWVVGLAWVKEHALDPLEDLIDIAATLAGGIVVWIVAIVIVLYYV